jgi:hypothetical protein
MIAQAADEASLWGTIATIVGLIGLGALVGFWWWLVDSFCFLRSTRYRGKRAFVAYPLAMIDLWNLMDWRSFRRPNRITQLFVEYCVLNPKPARTWGYQPSEKADREQHEREIADIGAWKSGLHRSLRDAEVATEKAEDQPPRTPVVEFGTCFELHEVVDDLQEFIESLQELERTRRLPKGFEAEMVTQIKIRDGYFSPLYLLGGLLPEFDKHWPRVIAKYGEILQRQRTHGESTVHAEICGRQLYQFVCWLIWGPSVPICDGKDGTNDPCRQWIEPRLQYGYGDEDNSILLKFSDDDFKKITSNPPGPPNRKPSGGNDLDELGTPLANRLSVTGKIKLRSQFAPDSMPEAQKGIHVTQGVGPRIVLDVTHRNRLPNDEKFKHQRYYGAYLWVMLWICREIDGKYQNLWSGDEEWRNLLPYFVHGNLAERTSYHHVCWLVAGAAVQGVRELSRVQDKQIRFVYVAAVDDSNCGCRLLLCEPNGETILDRLRVLKSQDETLSRLVLPRRSKGANVDPDWVYPEFNRGGNAQGIPVCGCHLPELVTEFVSKLSLRDA